MTVWYATFVADIPARFRGVDDVDQANGMIVITERETKRQLTLPSSIASP